MSGAQQPPSPMPRNTGVAWAMKDFGGMIPRRDSRLLPDANAEQATNCDLQAGTLAGLPVPQLLVDLSATAGTQRAYRFPGDVVGPGNPDEWLPLPSPYSSVCRSPLANDTTHRLYWTNDPASSNPGMFFTTYAGLSSSTPFFNVGIPQPSAVASGALTVTSSGGSVTPLVSRSYCYTYVNTFGEESAPNYPSTVVDGHPDDTWVITGLPTSAPANPVGFNYAPVTSINFYRTVTGATTGAQFLLVAQFAFSGGTPPTSPYNDTQPDVSIVNNNPLVSASWANPPVGLDGLVSFPGGFLIGFVGNSLYFSEVDQPHTWPPPYVLSCGYNISALAIWQASLMIMTEGYPLTGTGNTPGNWTNTQVRVPEPCISRSSVITDLMGVYYASQNGLVTLNYFGMQNQTLTTVTKNEWLTTFSAATLIACRHRAQYLALIPGTGGGFIIDYAEQRLGFVNISALQSATCIWNDEYNGATYICSGGKVYEWDAPSQPPMIYRWRSKQFYAPAPISLGAVQIASAPAMETPPPIPNTAQTLTNGDPTLVLPAGVNAVFNVYTGANNTLIFSRNLLKNREIFRLPSGFKAFDWQFEIVAQVPIHSIEVGSTMRDLKGV